MPRWCSRCQPCISHLGRARNELRGSHLSTRQHYEDGTGKSIRTPLITQLYKNRVDKPPVLRNYISFFHCPRSPSAFQQSHASAQSPTSNDCHADSVLCTPTNGMGPSRSTRRDGMPPCFLHSTPYATIIAATTSSGFIQSSDFDEPRGAWIRVPKSNSTTKARRGDAKAVRAINCEGRLPVAQ